ERALRARARRQIRRVIEEQFVILADESAHWRVAGLTQLERLRLSLGERSVAVCWSPEPPPAGGRILNSHLFLHRKALPDFLAAAPRIESDTSSWEELANAFQKSCPTAATWRFLHSPNEIPAAERDFLRRMGKPQDGVVSRFLNRPLTRPLTRFVLKFPITPTNWTLGIFVLPLLTAFFLGRGSYWSIVSGTAIYQLYSMLDGCDGEIARAKFLESKRGGRIDDLCDICGALLFVVALGVGLSRSLGWFYAAEGIALAALIAVNEWLLHQPIVEAPAVVSEAAYPRHRQLLGTLGNSLLARAALQITKRDVGILLFLLLALAGLPQWILHPWLLVTVGTFSLTMTKKLRAAL
ncbi:MAG: CDP-alcohol phosphatidyltransferase family protein, partial [Chthoniobacterales bacterium]